MRSLLVLSFFGIFFLFTPVVSGAQWLESEVFVTDAWGGKVETGAKAFVERGETWLPVEMIKWYSDEQIRVDLAEKRAYVTIDTPRFQLETENLDSVLKQGIVLNFPLKIINGKPYLNMFNLDRVLGITAKPRNEERSVELIPESSLGYSAFQINKPRQKAAFTGKINIVWDHVGGESRNLGNERSIDGLDVLSPTWFTVVNEEGLVLNKADERYVADAHEKKYKVWALLSNGFDRELTKKILQNEKAQQNIIRQVALYVSLYNLDGINLDFENVYEEDKEKLTFFVQQLATVLREQNVTLSIDITLPSSSSFWSRCYDRRELGRIADFVMVMAYDEHSRLSPVSGSVASLGWVDKGLAATLVEVPKEKLIMGIPFYTREWEETVKEGSVKVQSRTLSMAQAEQKITDNHAKPVWLEDKGQFYAEYAKEDKRYRIWLEDGASIKLKAELVHKYGLAGVASWRKDFETEEIWDILKAALKPASAKIDHRAKKAKK